ncbi:MAG: cytidine deaminase [Bacteroidales bacterium]|nr:cytidine deaminase [Bacteroidales bacterium]
MKKQQFISDYTVYDDEKDLAAHEAADAELLLRAHEATRNSYAPYSKFHVGAAVRLANGVIIQGNNIENAAYPSGLCAERVALFAAQAQYPDVPVEALAITACSDIAEVTEPVAPCGACRQVMVETEQRSNTPMRILCQGHTGPVFVFDGVETLMPFIFLTKFL